MKGSHIRNDARRSPLSGRPVLRRYEDSFDISELVDKTAYQRYHNEKWGGASFLNTSQENEEIVLDTTPASNPATTPTSSANTTPSSSVATSPASSRRATQEL